MHDCFLAVHFSMPVWQFFQLIFYEDVLWFLLVFSWRMFSSMEFFSSLLGAWTYEIRFSVDFYCQQNSDVCLHPVDAPPLPLLLLLLLLFCFFFLFLLSFILLLLSACFVVRVFFPLLGVTIKNTYCLTHMSFKCDTPDSRNTKHPIKIKLPKYQWKYSRRKL